MRTVSKSHGWVEIDGGVTTPRGFVAAAVSAGVKPGTSRDDLALLCATGPSHAAGVFTKNLVVAAPVVVSREHLAASRGRARAIIVNSGNANACTGRRGLKDAEQMTETAAAAARTTANATLVASTGVIGLPLPIHRITRAVPALAGRLSPGGGGEFSLAILTTDTRRKVCAFRSEREGKAVTIAGAAKGSGMIHPRLATMLAFITTDAAVTPALLKTALREAAAVSFNRVTVDGDTSTNDSVFLLANGASGSRPIVNRGPACAHFVDGLTKVCVSLARQIARDGEGARKLVEINVSGAPTEADADRMARAIANSPLVKTAVAGADPNWGRIACAAGYAGVKFDPARLDVEINGIRVCRRGEDARADEKTVARALMKPEVRLDVNIHRGAASATVWTCDFTKDYIAINASYRT
ncbi:MAG: bifunctional glutamate N-acetyltransferase/amino-acid acetyltransferase ArgJ [Deltaproteobacteria bacterium]|nr:bifunctional glutamate N-acetyltransferase/amino-acid acetyltransferase ArgJ [Deltaproteobacteria bacterium]